MLKIRTVCGNGIGSSLMCAGIVSQICAENQIDKVDVASAAFNEASSEKADLYITVQELADQLLADGYNVAVIRSYTNKRKITEDVLEKIQSLTHR